MKGSRPVPPDKKTYKILFFTALLFFALGKGQPVTNGVSTLKQEPDSSMQAYLQQEHRFEFRNYQMYYNGQLIKADTLKNIYKIFGKPKKYEYLTYYIDKPLSLKTKYIYDNYGKPWKERNYIVDKGGDTIKIVDHYTIQISAFTSFRIEDSLAAKLKQIPGLNGYILVNGVLVDKNTKPQELRNKLGKIKNGSLSMMMGMPVLTYSPEPGHSFTEYDPKKDPGDDYIRIDFEYEKDRETGEFLELKYITYYYSIKQ